MTSDTTFQESNNVQQNLNNYSNNTNEQPAPVKIIRLNNGEMLAYEQHVFSIVSEKNGKLTFIELLEVVGGPAHKQVLYKALASLAKQGKITRIRGIGKSRIEFFYYDTKKLRKAPQSASVSYVSL